MAALAAVEDSSQQEGWKVVGTRQWAGFWVFHWVIIDWPSSTQVSLTLCMVSKASRSFTYYTFVYWPEVPWATIKDVGRFLFIRFGVELMCGEPMCVRYFRLEFLECLSIVFSFCFLHLISNYLMWQNSMPHWFLLGWIELFWVSFCCIEM